MSTDRARRPRRGSVPPALRPAALVAGALLLAACDSGPGVVITGADTDSPLPRPEDAGPDDAVEPMLQAAFSTPGRGLLRARSGTVGGAGGAGSLVDECGAGQVLAGLKGSADGVIGGVAPLCVDVDLNGAWSGEPLASATVHGGGGSAPFERVCPSGSALVDFEGGTSFDVWSTGVVGSLGARCRSLADPTTVEGPAVALPRAGAATGDEALRGCGEGSVATGIHGRAGAVVDALGLICLERPSGVGRWSDVIGWPLISIHSILVPDGRVMSYGTTLSGEQGAHFDYDVWDPETGTGTSSHLTLDNTLGVDMFCSASVVLASSGNVLMPGGDARFGGARNSGIVDATLFDPVADALSAAADMAFGRWYATAVTLADGDVLTVGGIDSARNQAFTPEIYLPEEDRWRSLLGVDTSRYPANYPRLWAAPDGRVFGIAGRDMYRIDTAGQGSLEPAGRLPDVAFGWESTAVMYRPGRILVVGGGRGDGRGAVTVDIDGTEPVVRVVESPSQSRRAWSDSTVLPDGTVLVTGGSPRPNDAADASLSAELWDPDTGRWTRLSDGTLPRLYHSTTTLLPDGRVLAAGGGAPGPLLNRNAEIFSPPYLFDGEGRVAERPAITSAPAFAAHGQEIAVNARSERPIARATLVKGTAVTHSFNMEQRFVELALDVTADGSTVTLPPAALATPGYYLLHLLDEDGVPSPGHVLRLGDEPAPATPEPEPEPEPEPGPGDDLLANGGFERGLESWLDCAAPALTGTTGDAHSGDAALRVEGGGCLYQEFAAVPGRTYAFECRAKTGELEYAALSHLMYDAGYAELAADSVQVVSSDYGSVRVDVTAPEGASVGSVNLYAEGVGTFDRCGVRDVTGSAPPSPGPIDPSDPLAGDDLLRNGDFENGDDGWFDCAEASLTNVSDEASGGAGAMRVDGAGCLYQEFAVRAGERYELSCDARSEGVGYSSVSMRVTDGAYIELAAADVPVGRDAYATYRTGLDAPADAVHGAITLYSEDAALFDDCTVVER